MKEFIEKLIARLEEEQEGYSDTTYYAYGVGSAIKIVNKLAEEYNNGWIPCSERLPDCCGYPVLLTVENVYGQRSVCKAFTNYMKEGKLLFYTNEKEYCSELTSSKLSDAWKPIAWQPLPEPYKAGDAE